MHEHWNGLPFPTPGDLLHPGIKPASLVSPALADGFFTTPPPGKHLYLLSGGNKSFSDLKSTSMLLDTLYREVMDRALI